ncbi:hypothetical protein J3R04_001499 [Spirilliplanes yamanashiensis]|nr:hypothetical protein [Spirilliplanes yamanashiensis]MDP9815529.1 hypothetical protein [Spirilliplanes yamanashiensis]
MTAKINPATNPVAGPPTRRPSATTTAVVATTASSDGSLRAAVPVPASAVHTFMAA